MASTRIVSGIGGGIFTRGKCTPSFYDRDRMMPSQTGIDYLLPIFTDAIGEDDMEVVRAKLFAPGCLTHAYHSINTDIQKPHPLYRRPNLKPMSIHVALHHRIYLHNMTGPFPWLGPPSRASAASRPSNSRTRILSYSLLKQRRCPRDHFPSIGSRTRSPITSRASCFRRKPIFLKLKSTL